MTEYRRCQPVTKEIKEALPVLRQGDLDAGGRMLDAAWEALSRTEVVDPSIRAVLERWYYGALGYYHYRREAFDEADQVMAQAHEAVAGALGRWKFLLIIADEAVDIHMHRARIARNRQRWQEMRAHIDAAWAMREGRLPYHVLPDGTSIGFSDVIEFLDSLPVPEGTHLLAPHLQDVRLRRQEMQMFVREIVRIPGFVIRQS